MSTTTRIVTGQVAAGATAAFTANVKKLDGTSYAPAEISTITATIVDNGAYSNATPTTVTGFDNKSLTVADVMFTATSKTYNGVQYTRNFEWIPDIADLPFKDAGHIYQVTITFTPATAGGLCSPLVFSIKTV